MNLTAGRADYIVNIVLMGTEAVMHRSIVATSAGLFLACTGISATTAADLIWEVESPFRLFRTPASFALHENAFLRVRGEPGSPPPADIIWRLERSLNDLNCKDRSTPEKCFATRGPHYNQSRLGWAARTLPTVCYDSDGSPRRYPVTCDRKYSLGTVREDNIRRAKPTSCRRRTPSTSGCRPSMSPMAIASGAGGRAPAPPRPRPASSPARAG